MSVRNVVIMSNIFYEKKFCPFCLAKHDNYMFMSTTKNGKPSKNCTCPSCKESFRLQSFHEINAMNTEEFAVWVANYAYWGFWKKVKNHQLWFYRMNNSGQSQTFWNKYREIKPKTLSESEQQKQLDDDYKSYSEHNKN